MQNYVILINLRERVPLNSDTMKIEGSYQQSFDASLAQSQLEAAGIESCLLNDTVNNVVSYLSSEVREIRLGVADEDYDRAMEVLNQPVEEKGKTCPFCGSHQIVFGTQGASKWRIIWTTILSTLTMSAGNVRCHYYCKNCRQEF